MTKPTVADLNLAKYILTYLRRTCEKSLTFKKSETSLKLVGFSDSYWGGNIEDIRSFSGYAFHLCEGRPLVLWKSKKQQTFVNMRG